MGKTFTLELCLRDLGVLPVCLSAGEVSGMRMRVRAGGLPEAQPRRQLRDAPHHGTAPQLEDEWAGEPGRRLRERYLFAGARVDGEGRVQAQSGCNQ